MAYQIKNVYNLETLLKYCSDALNWPIEEDWFEDIDDLFYDFSATDLGIRQEEFAHIRSLRQLRPLVDDQPWGIFVVDFESNDLSESWVIIASNVGNELWKVNIIEIKEKWVREKDITVAMPENSV